MRFTDPFIRRPVLAIVVSALLLMLGIQSGSQMQVRQFPEVEKSLIAVTTYYPGASARTVQGFVTDPLQRRIAAANGVEYITSASNPGASTIRAYVRLGENSSDVLNEVIAKVDEARFELPNEVEDPVVTTTFGDEAMIYVAFFSDQMSLQQVHDYVRRAVQPELSTLEGVGEVKILDRSEFAMRIWLDPARMAAYGVTATDVSSAISRENYISAAGTTRGELVRASVDAETDLRRPEDFGRVVVRQEGDLRVLLDDVAELEMASADYDSAAFSSGRPTVFLSITPTPSANPLEVARRIKELSPKLAAEAGKAPREAALQGVREVALPVIAMTLTLAAVYAPIGFLGGLTGVLFTEFALTLAGAVVMSGIIALTLSPMMCAHVLKDHEHQGAAANWLDARFAALHDAYRNLLRHCLDNRGAVLLFAAGILASLPVLFALAQRELAPEEDVSSLFIVAEPPDYGSLDYTNYFLDEMVRIWKDIPEVKSSWQVNSPRDVFGGLELLPWSKRERTQQEIQAEVQEKFSKISGLQIYTFGWASMPGTDSGLPVNFVVASTADYDELERVSEELLQKARESGLFAFVNKSLRYSRPEVVVDIDRRLAARLGISMQDIGDTLQVMLGEAEINRFSIEGRSYKVILQAGRGFRLTKEWLERYYLRTDGGELAPLSTVISLDQRVEPNTLSQYQQLNSVTVQGMMIPPHSLGTGLAFLEEALDEVAPTGYRAGYEGESRRFVQEREKFAVLFAVSMIFIFLVLAAQFNSFRDPLVVLVAVPLSIFGAVVPLALGWATLNIYTQVGLLTLIGLISKHGILIVDFANRQVERGLDRKEAVLEAAVLRLRPILMTTFATVLGVMPLLLAFGAGANSRYAIGLTIAAGMSIGTLFTLFVLPTFYLPFLKRREAAAAAAESAA